MNHWEREREVENEAMERLEWNELNRPTMRHINIHRWDCTSIWDWNDAKSIIQRYMKKKKPFDLDIYAKPRKRNTMFWSFSIRIYAHCYLVICLIENINRTTHGIFARTVHLLLSKSCWIKSYSKWIFCLVLRWKNIKICSGDMVGTFQFTS